MVNVENVIETVRSLGDVNKADIMEHLFAMKFCPKCGYMAVTMGAWDATSSYFSCKQCHRTFEVTYRQTSD